MKTHFCTVIANFSNTSLLPFPHHLVAWTTICCNAEKWRPFSVACVWHLTNATFATVLLTHTHTHRFSSNILRYVFITFTVRGFLFIVYCLRLRWKMSKQQQTQRWQTFGIFSINIRAYNIYIYKYLYVCLVYSCCCCVYLRMHKCLKNNLLAFCCMLHVQHGH